MGMAYVTADDVDTSSWGFNDGPPYEPPPPYVPPPGCCPSQTFPSGRPCNRPAGHPPNHRDGHGTSWWPVSCVTCGGNHEAGVEVAEFKPHRYRCVSAIGCRKRQKRQKLKPDYTEREQRS